MTTGDRTGRTARRRAAIAVVLGLGVSAATLGPANAASQPPGANVANPAILRTLNSGEQAMLGRNGFVVTAPSRQRPRGEIFPGDPRFQSDTLHPVYWQFYDLYEENFRDQIPSFVTSDTLLHTFHVIYDGSLVALERSSFVPALIRLNKGLVDVAAFQYGATHDAAVREAARLNMGYVAVAQSLLDPGAAIPALVATQVRRELALIAAHHGAATSPLFGYTVDYSLFVPRGHYASDATLSRYFEAMAWYGILTFHLNGGDADLRTRQALLLVRGLTRTTDLGPLWASVFDPITTWVGRSDDLTIRDYAGVMRRVYADTAPVSVLADPVRLARFRSLANALPAPQIRGDIVASGNGAAKQSKGLRLFGQRFTPDSAIMQALIWDKVGTPQQPRLWPSGLDVAAALGSAPAATILDRTTHQTRYAHYATQSASVRSAYVSLPTAAWHQNLYWSWLDTLRAAWGPVAPAAPAFMKTSAWGAKSLATGLGSWAELRHDTLLYVKQVSGLGGGGPAPLPVAYVEPAPLLYARLLALTQQLKATLAVGGTLDRLPQPVIQYPSYAPPGYTGEKGYRAVLDDFASQIALAQRVAERELLGQPVSRADLLAVMDMGNHLNGVDDFFRDNAAGKFLTFYFKQVAAVADVFTEPISGQVLEEGVGDVLPMYAVVMVNGRAWLARGGVYSYYEFHQPMSNRLTDEAWRSMARHPSLPTWTAGYIAP